MRLVCSANTHQRLNEAGQAIFNNVNQEPQLILVILPQAAADLRLQVKNWGDVEKGVATQCVVSVLPPPRFSSRLTLLGNSASRKYGVVKHIVPMTSIATTSL